MTGEERRGHEPQYRFTCDVGRVDKVSVYIVNYVLLIFFYQPTDVMSLLPQLTPLRRGVTDPLA